jgi:hypothetical protein
MPDPHLGFETIGNATLIVHDEVPVLVTDPWITGAAYFGSWGLSHEIPTAQRASIDAARHIWVSHGHPDHLSMPSLELLRDRPILLPDHRGGRIAAALRADGFEVRVLEDRRWYPLSDRVSVCSVADWNQDAILLVDVDGVLVADVNDASDRGWGRFVRRTAARYDTSFLLALSGYGDADMINFFRPDGERIPPLAARRDPPGAAIVRRMDALGMTHFVPFASHHQYERTDSAWANEYTTPIEDHAIGFEADNRTFVPPFMRYDRSTGEISHLAPASRRGEMHEPAEFGDDWTEEPDEDDVRAISEYFSGIATLEHVVDEVTVCIGSTRIEVRIGQGTGRGVRFDAPRRSFVDAVRWRIFDDLLIGNFMRTTLTGDWTPADFGREFTPRLAKYADNGLARTEAELRAYMRDYESRARTDVVRWKIERATRSGMTRTARALRRRVRGGSVVQRMGSRAYRRVRAR